MTKKVKVHNIYEITWPHACAKCGSSQNLVNVATLENKLTRKIAKKDPQLEYLVCQNHAKWLALANLSVDSCGTMTLIRLLSNFSTTIFSIFLLTLPLQLIHKSFSDISVPYILIIFVAYIGFSWFLRKQLPIRKIKLSVKKYIFEFDNHEFAERFVKENQQHTIIERLN